MGWASGSSLMSDIIKDLNEVGIGPLQRLRLYKRLIKSFRSFDCDTLGECLEMDQAFDDAYEAEREE